MTDAAANSVRSAARDLAPTTKQRILDVAVRRFHEDGYGGTSLREIADELGVTKAALYYHFRSKEEILDAVVRPILDGVQALLDDVGSSALSTPSARRAFVSRFVDELAVFGPHAVSVIADPGLARHVRQHVDGSGLPARVARLLEHGLTAGGAVTDEGEARLRVAFAMAGLPGAQAAWHHGAAPDSRMDRRAREVLADMFLTALGDTPA